MLEYSMLYPRNTKSRRAVSIDGMWNFQFDPESRGKEQGWQDKLPNPIQMPVPASFADFFTDKNSREYTGDFWYETEVFIPEEWTGKDVILRFGSVTHRARIFINGMEIGFHEGGFLPFCIDITEIAKYNQYNKITVLVNNELNETMLPAGRTITLANGKKMAKPYFDFYNYSGIQRPVKLIAQPKEMIKDFELNYTIVGENAKVEYRVITTGTNQVELEVYTEGGVPVAKACGKEGVFEIPKVQLWQVRNSYLYQFVFRILEEQEIIDEYFEEIGIRTVEIKGTDICINGKPVYLKGFGKHEDSDIVGRGFQLGVLKRDFECMKWIGANSFRTSHYPYSEEVYQLADREGFLVIDEVPAVGFMESLVNFMDASSGKTTAWFDKETIPELKKNHLKAIEEMITRDKNHACVFAWSLLNEPDTLTESAREYFKEIFEAAWELDIQKRPRTFALLMSSTPNRCKCYSYSDFISLNRYYGWYRLGGYEIINAEEEFRKEMDAWKQLNLNKPFIFTEYGADTSPSEHKLPSVMWSQEYQIEYLEMCHRVFDSYEFIKGEQVWNFADFQTTEGIMRMNGNKKGIFTRQRQPKESAFYFKKRWESLPLDYKGK